MSSGYSPDDCVCDCLFPKNIALQQSVQQRLESGLIKDCKSKGKIYLGELPESCAGPPAETPAGPGGESAEPAAAGQWRCPACLSHAPPPQHAAPASQPPTTEQQGLCECCSRSLPPHSKLQQPISCPQETIWAHVSAAAEHCQCTASCNSQSAACGCF